MNRNLPKTILVGILFALSIIPMAIIYIFKPPRESGHYQYKCVEGFEIAEVGKPGWVKYIPYKMYSREDIESIGLSPQTIDYYFRKVEL